LPNQIFIGTFARPFRDQYERCAGTHDKYIAVWFSNTVPEIEKSLGRDLDILPLNPYPPENSKIRREGP